MVGPVFSYKLFVLSHCIQFGLDALKRHNLMSPDGRSHCIIKSSISYATLIKDVFRLSFSSSRDQGHNP